VHCLSAAPTGERNLLSWTSPSHAQETMQESMLMTHRSSDGSTAERLNAGHDGISDLY
jgi:hypothetical protein